MKLYYSYIRRLCAYITDRLYQFKRFLQLSIDGLGHSCPVFTKVTGILPVALVCFQFVCLAQSSRLGGTTGIGEIKPLQIGDTIPEELWHMPLQVINHPDGKDTITLNDYRDKKLIILDFWATWCGSCLEGFPLVSALQDEFNKDVQFVMVNSIQTGDSKGKINHTLERIGLPNNLLMINQDSVFQKLFPHRILPHFIWIDTDGYFLASSRSNEISSNNIETFLTSDHSGFHQKIDNMYFDKNATLLEQFNVIDPDNIKCSSLLISYQEGLGSGYGFTNIENHNRLYYLNTTLSFLYQQAFSNILNDIDYNRLIFDFPSDSSFWEQYTKTGYDNRYCYELISDRKSLDAALELMRFDLERNFGYTVNKKEKETEVYRINAVPDYKKVENVGETMTVGHLIRQLNKVSQTPFVIDESIDKKLIAFDLSELNKNITDADLTTLMDKNKFSYVKSLEKIPYAVFSKLDNKSGQDNLGTSY